MTSLRGTKSGAKHYYRQRREVGGAIALSTGLAFALVVLGLGFVALVLIMGAENETRNAVDSGALNVSKQALDKITVGGGEDPTSWVRGVTSDSTDASVDCDGKMSLRRINRLWGAALLIAINADAAQNDGNAGSGESNAQQACQQAQSISDNLAQQLKTPANLFDFFTNFSTANSVRMMGLGTQTKVKSDGDWRTSYMYAQSESNLVITGSPPNFNLPPGYSLNSGWTTCQRNPPPPDSKNMYFLKGYVPITAAGQTFWQVPYQFEEKPHLESQYPFAQSIQDMNSEWSNPVPNAFSTQGITNKNGAINEIATAFVSTNPNQPFQLSIPHSFLRIHLDQMKSHWWFFPTGYPPLELDPTEDYGYIPDTQTNIPSVPGGVLCSSVTPDEVEIGLEVVGQPLDGIIFNYPFGDTGKLESYMVNRINEMMSVVGVTKTSSDLHSCLQDPKTIGYLNAGVTDFCLYSPDGKNIICEPQELAAGKNPKWLPFLISNDPDGTETELSNSTDPAPFFFEPVVTPAPFCSPFLALGWGMYGKKLSWTPGTGSNGCLGQVHVNRWTDVYSLGVCNPL